MEKLKTGLLTAVLLAACATPRSVEPGILSTVADENPTAVPSEPESYLIRVNFVLFAEEIALCPHTAQAFKLALEEWTSVLPVECAVYIDVPGNFPFMPLGPESMADEPGVIRVHLVDIQEKYGVPNSLLGFWRWPDNTLALDADFLELDPALAMGTALHELGHVFGLSHVINSHSPNGMTGSYVLPSPHDASTMVMFPILSDRNKFAALTKLEIELALQNLPNLQRIARNDCFHLTGR